MERALDTPSGLSPFHVEHGWRELTATRRKLLLPAEEVLRPGAGFMVEPVFMLRRLHSTVRSGRSVAARVTRLRPIRLAPSPPPRNQGTSDTWGDPWRSARLVVLPPSTERDSTMARIPSLPPQRTRGFVHRVHQLSTPPVDDATIEYRPRRAPAMHRGAPPFPATASSRGRWGLTRGHAIAPDPPAPTRVEGSLGALRTLATSPILGHRRPGWGSDLDREPYERAFRPSWATPRRTWPRGADGLQCPPGDAPELTVTPAHELHG